MTDRRARLLPPWLLAALLVPALLALTLLSLWLGEIEVAIPDVLRALWSGPADSQDLAAVIVREVRLPRTLTAALTGAALALAGLLMQGVLLNPLAEPYTLGVSAGAAFGAALAILLPAMLGAFGIPLLAFAGAALAFLLTLKLATVDGQAAPVSLILAGVIVSAVLAAGIGFMKYLADERAAQIVFWLLGSFSHASWSDVTPVALATLCAMAVGFLYARELDVLSLGADTAVSLGIAVERTRYLVLGLASLAAALCVSVCGIIGFVGLIVPHGLRLLSGPSHAALVPLCALGGGVLLAGADLVARTCLPHEPPAGVLTALLGGLFFFAIFRSRIAQAGRLE